MTISLTLVLLCACAPPHQRAMLVPTLRALGSSVVIAQTRGRDFVDACTRSRGAYEVDVYRADGTAETEVVHIEGTSTQLECFGLRASTYA